MQKDFNVLHIEQLFMIEVFAGGAVLTSVAKQYGLGGIAVDKVRKQNSRSTIYQLDLMQAADRELLEEWLSSPFCYGCILHRYVERRAGHGRYPDPN